MLIFTTLGVLAVFAAVNVIKFGISLLAVPAED